MSGRSEAGRGTAAASGRRRLWPLWALIAIIGLPMVAAVTLNFHRDWLPQGRSNRGDLIQPPRSLGGRRLALTEGGELALDTLLGKWVMLAITNADCARPCRRRAHDLRQVRLATGADRDRVERLLWFSSPPGDAALGPLRESYPHMILARDDGAEGIAELVSDRGEPGSVYLIDPMGNLMMRYRHNAPADDILKDIKHLLRLSEEWQ